jgi:cytoskeleton protein RodZ
MTEKTSDSNEQSEIARIGNRLRKERVRQKLSDKDIASHLHLSTSRVKDLEEGRVGDMATIYWRGYIRSYARMLGMDPANILANIEPDQPPELREILPASRRAWKFDRFLKFATYALVTTVIVPPLVIIYLQSGWRMVDADLISTSTAGEQAVTSSEERMAGRIARALATDEDEARAVAPGHVSASALPLSAVRPMRPTESALSPASLLPLDFDGEAAEPDQTLELTLRLLEDTWVEITAADGQRLEYDLLRAGQQLSYRGLPPYKILLGRANSVELQLGGEILRYDGHDRGEVVQLQLLAGGEIVR